MELSWSIRYLKLVNDCLQCCVPSSCDLKHFSEMPDLVFKLNLFHEFLVHIPNWSEVWDLVTGLSFACQVLTAAFQLRILDLPIIQPLDS